MAKLLLPTLSSLAFLPTVSIAAKRRFHMEAMVYLFTTFFVAVSPGAGPGPSRAPSGAGGQGPSLPHLPVLGDAEQGREGERKGPETRREGGGTPGPPWTSVSPAALAHLSGLDQTPEAAHGSGSPLPPALPTQARRGLQGRGCVWGR